MSDTERAWQHGRARSVYVTSLEPHSGRSVVTLGLMELLSARVPRVGFLRPIAESGSGRDPEIELIRRRYRLKTRYEDMYALTDREAQAAIAAGAYEEVEQRVVATYRALERHCDVVVCEGTGPVESMPALDLGLDARLANHLGCPVLVVVKGIGDVVGAVCAARAVLERRGCELFGVIVNRVAPPLLPRVRAALADRDGGRPVYVLPEHPQLACPTVGEVASALRARLVSEASAGERHPPSSVGLGDVLQREVRDIRVAAMSAQHFLGDIADGTLVIASGDRPDIMVASLAAALSPGFPVVAGIVITAEHQLDPAVRRLLAAAPFPVLQVPVGGTYMTTTAIQAVRARIGEHDERKIATALGVFQSSVDTVELQERISLERPARLTPVMFEYELFERARAARRHIVLPEGTDHRVLRAADILLRRDVVDLTILGAEHELGARAATLGLDLSGARFLDPITSPLRSEYAHLYYRLRCGKGLTEEAALDAMADVNVFGTMLVYAGAADGMVSGATHTTANTIRPALQIIRTRSDASVVSSVFFMCLADRVLVYGDCAVNPDPTVDELADIAISSAQTAATFGIEPRVAMLSYSTGASGKGEKVEAVRRATALVRERAPELPVEGPIQYDAAVDTAVAARKLPGSAVAGHATVFVFPDLHTGNIAYKAVQRSAGAVAIGPVLQGLSKPVNDLSRGCTETDIVNTVVITAIQAQAAANAEPGAPASTRQDGQPMPKRPAGPATVHA